MINKSNQPQSIFEKYPQEPFLVALDPKTGEELADQGTVNPVLNRIMSAFASEEYVPLDESATTQEQLDNLDANVSRRIHKLGTGLVTLTVGGVLTKYGGDVGSVPGGIMQGFGVAGYLLGALQASKIGRIDSISRIHTYDSKVRRPDNFVLSMISPRLYERARNRRMARKLDVTNKHG